MFNVKAQICAFFFFFIVNCTIIYCIIVLVKSIGCVNMLEIKNLKKVYKVGRRGKLEALKDVNLKFGNRGLVFIVGKSGSGKSTLLNQLGGLDEPTKGKVF